MRPGPITFVISNAGTMIHGFEIEAEDDDGDHSGPGHGELKLEGPAFDPGETVRIDAVLPPAGTRSSASSRSTTPGACAPP